MSDRDEFEAWLQQGIANDWITTLFCLAHVEDTASCIPGWVALADDCRPVVLVKALEQIL